MQYIPYFLAMFGFFVMCFVSLLTFSATNNLLHMGSFLWDFTWINVIFVMMMKRYYRDTK